MSRDITSLFECENLHLRADLLKFLDSHEYFVRVASFCRKSHAEIQKQSPGSAL